jgi:hypothetical protein
MLKERMMRRLLFLALIPFLLASCIDYWVNPISDIEDAQVDEDLIGTWASGDEQPEIFFHILDEGKNWMRFVWVEKDDKPLQGRMYISWLDGRTFLNIKLHDPCQEGFAEKYLIAEYEISAKGSLVFRMPQSDFLKKAVEDKVLSAEMDGENLTILSSSSDIRAFIRKAPQNELFSETVEYRRLEDF